MRSKKLLVPMAMAIMATTLACINASPSECVKAAEKAGLPDEVIEQLKKPGDLNAAERFALNRVLSKAGIDDLCGEVSGKNGQGPMNTGLQEPGEEMDNPESTEDPEEPNPTAELLASIPEEDEYRRRCRFWALNNLDPIVFQEFAKLDPDDMDDLDRILWRSQLHPNRHPGFYNDDHATGEEIPSLQLRDEGIINCRNYWIEPLGPDNADLRNHGFETQCRTRLEERIISRYSPLADALNHKEETELVYQTQPVRQGPPVARHDRGGTPGIPQPPLRDHPRAEPVPLRPHEKPDSRRGLHRHLPESVG